MKGSKFERPLAGGKLRPEGACIRFTLDFLASGSWYEFLRLESAEAPKC
jgi:hypothetical protein